MAQIPNKNLAFLPPLHVNQNPCKSMAPQSTRIPPSLPKPSRKPLHPKNFTAYPAINSEKPNLAIEERAEKENFEISDFDDEMKIREMDGAFERWMIGAERRLHELLVAEMDIRRLVRAMRTSAFMSLRASEEKKRWQAAQLQENGNAAGKRISDSSEIIKK